MDVAIVWLEIFVGKILWILWFRKKLIIYVVYTSILPLDNFMYGVLFAAWICLMFETSLHTMESTEK